MIVITTKSSTRVKPRGKRGEGREEREDKRPRTAIRNVLLLAYLLCALRFCVRSSELPAFPPLPNQNVPSVVAETFRDDAGNRKIFHLPSPFGEGWDRCGRYKGWRVCPPHAPQAPLPQWKRGVLVHNPNLSPKPQSSRPKSCKSLKTLFPAHGVCGLLFPPGIGQKPRDAEAANSPKVPGSGTAAVALETAAVVRQHDVEVRAVDGPVAVEVAHGPGGAGRGAVVRQHDVEVRAVDAAVAGWRRRAGPKRRLPCRRRVS